MIMHHSGERTIVLQKLNILVLMSKVVGLVLEHAPFGHVFENLVFCERIPLGLLKILLLIK